MAIPERRTYMNFTKPYLQIPLVLVTRPNELFFSDIGSINDKKIAVIKGYAYGEILRVKYPRMQLVEVSNAKEGMKKVLYGEIFGFIDTLATSAYQIQKNYTTQLKIAGKFDEHWDLGIGVRNDEPLLFSIFEKAIESIDKLEHQKILNKWIALNYADNYRYKEFFWKLVALVIFLGLLIAYRQYALNKYNKKLEILSSTDKLTGVYNRLKLDEIMVYELQKFNRYKQPLSIILLDIDNFKLINDTYGHHKGDIFLQELSYLIQQNIRNTDCLGRWGGEEFLIILPHTDIEDAHKVAQNLQKLICEHQFSFISKQSASFGVVSVHLDESIDTFFERVDKALYTSKKLGKNRVTIDL
ncbi:MAG: GGDEF domain-containing protein [Sulfurospirillum sp.]|nr:GGDEF domain-containing protein [Sulfurospirillum sp.]